LVIKELPEEVKAYISAAQGTPTPEYVIKELIENSIDAFASKIEVDITSPFSFKVKDNGIGIPYEDLPKTIKRFYTSKVYSLKDVKALKSLGYRGEALHSIALISKLTIKSKYKEENIGGILKSIGGNIILHKPFSFSQGTLVLVEDLYYNFPARRKSVKEKKFFNFVKNLLFAYYLAYENISFVLKTKDNIISLLNLPFEEKLKLIFKDKSYSILEGKYFKIIYSDEKVKNFENIFILNKRPMDFKFFEKKFLSPLNLNFKTVIAILNVPNEYIDIHLSPYKDKFEFTSKSFEKLILENIKDTFTQKIYPFYSKERFLLKEAESENIFNLKLLGFLGEDILVGYTDKYVYYFDFHLIFEIYNSQFLNLSEKQACKYALVKKGDMDLDTLKDIIFEIFSSGKITCPHGRPLFVKESINNILKKLKRKR